MQNYLIKKYIFIKLPRYISRPIIFLIDSLAITKVFRSQSNESLILRKLLKNRLKKQEVFFTEFGFDPTEFNCARMSNRGIKGQLFEMNLYKVEIGQRILHKNTSVISRKLRIEDMRYLTAENRFHIISIDVDGVDYEFASEALKLKPDILIVEYNAIFQNKRVKIPFNQDFDRFDYHRNYFGCSLTSLVDLSHRNNYCLAGVSISAVNAFFVPTKLLQQNECLDNLNYGLHQNQIGLQSRSGTRNLNQMYEEIECFPLENLDHLKILCPARKT